MEKQEQEIIFDALMMFSKYGVRSVTMDDIARELGISKKTLYVHFENKADLVHKAVWTVHETIKEQMVKIHAETDNPIDELLEIDKVVSQIMENHSPSMRFQLQKYYPETFAALYEGRHELVHKMISENMEKGKERGLYRPDADTGVVSYLYCSKMETLHNEEEKLLEKHSIGYVMRQSLEYHIRGIATEKGVKYLQEKIKTENLTQ